MRIGLVFGTLVALACLAGGAAFGLELQGESAPDRDAEAVFPIRISLSNLAAPAAEQPQGQPEPADGAEAVFPIQVRPPANPPANPPAPPPARPPAPQGQPAQPPGQGAQPQGQGAQPQGQGQPASPAPQNPPAQPAATPPAAAQPSLTNVATLPESSRPEMLGDLPPLSALFVTPQGTVVLPRPRTFKIADNENPGPQTRTYYTFNDFSNFYQSVNQGNGGAVHNIGIQQDTFGVESAFLNNLFSVGVRLPTYTTSAQSSIAGLNGTHTVLGDLSFIMKGLLWREGRDDVISAGLAVTPPTGASSLFNDSRFAIFRNTTLQPFVGYVWTEGPWYLQGFFSLDIPTDENDVLLFFTDASLRYALYENASRTAPISGIEPSAELHLNTPLNHRGLERSFDPAATPDILDVTLGIDVYFFHRAKAVFGFVTPVTGPRPVDYELLSQFKLLF
jgi:hypothetical protein